MKDKTTKPAGQTTSGEDSQRILITFAWAAVLIISIPRIVYRLLVPLTPGDPVSPMWLAWITVGCVAFLWILTWVWKSIKPLRGYFLALIALCVGWNFVYPFISENATWSGWLERQSWGVWIVGYLGIRLIITALVAVTLIGSGIGRKELYLVRGKPNAVAKRSRLLGDIAKEHTPWTRVISKWIPYYIVILLVVVGIQTRPNMNQVLQAVKFLPFIFIAAAINAFNEEFQFRSMILARSENVVGSQMAIYLSAAFFGLQHYFGSPGGPFGVLMAAYLGWISAKSMVETKGFVWAFLIHFVGDFLIYIFWAMAV